MINLRLEGTVHSQNSGQVQDDCPRKTKVILWKIKLLFELLLPWLLLEGTGRGRFTSFICPLEKWSAVVKISQWVIRHYQLSAEDDWAGEVTCSQGPDGLPSLNATDGRCLSPISPNFPRKKRIRHCTCEGKHILSYKWLMNVYTQYKPKKITGKQMIFLKQ